MSIFGLFRKPMLRRELESVRHEIEGKRSQVAVAERECRKAWGKKWSYIHRQRRRHDGEREAGSGHEQLDGQSQVFEMRRQQCLMELKTREQELEGLLAREKRLAAELGDKSVGPPEEHGEKR